MDSIVQIWTREKEFSGAECHPERSVLGLPNVIRRGFGRDLHLVWIARLVLSSSGRLFPLIDALARDGITDGYLILFCDRNAQALVALVKMKISTVS